MKTQDTDKPLDALRCLCRYETHGGYVWAGLMTDGALMCVTCLRANYRKVFRETRDNGDSGWALQYLTSSDAADGETDLCCNCGEVLWGEP